MGPGQALLLNGDDPADGSFASQLAFDDNKNTRERCTGTHVERTDAREK